jgi:hypothetical protein
VFAATAVVTTAVRFKPIAYPWWLGAAPAKPDAPAQNIALERAISQPFVPASIIGPTRIPAAWLPRVEKRLRDSTLSDNVDAQDDGSWLTGDIATAAERFFQATSDLLPGEPYMYSSTKGDLVADFKFNAGSMTSIIGSDFVFSSVAIDGRIAQQRLKLENKTTDETLHELRRLITTLLARDHGSVDSEQR